MYLCILNVRYVLLYTGETKINDTYLVVNYDWVYNLKAEIVTHISGRLLDQAAILFIGIPFQNGNFA